MRVALAWLALLLAAGSCSNSQLERAVGVETTSCGHASGTNGAGVIVGNNRVLAAAHVVIGATEVRVRVNELWRAAEIVRLDSRTDLALLQVDGVRAAPVDLAEAQVGDELELIGGGPSLPTVAEISRAVEVRIEEVRSERRSSRNGYELDHEVELGDSGGGAFASNGGLVGIVFGRMQNDPSRSFIVGAEEISLILDKGEDQSFACDPEQSRVVPKN